MELTELVSRSILVSRPTKVAWLDMCVEETIDLTDVGQRYDRAYNTDYSGIVFVLNHNVYVTPYSESVIMTLKGANFGRVTSIFIPGCSCSTLLEFTERWSELLSMAAADRIHNYEDKCVTFANSHGIGMLTDDQLSLCFRIPLTGVQISQLGRRDIVFPAIDENKCVVPAILGTYNVCRRMVCFIYRDGHTYVTQGLWIIDYLTDHGYSRNNQLEVPFSGFNTEFTDPSLADLFDCCKGDH